MCFGRDRGARNGIKRSDAMLKHFVLLHNMLQASTAGHQVDHSRVGFNGLINTGMMLLPDETYEERSASRRSSSASNGNADSLEDNEDNEDVVDAAKALADLKRCDDFLKRHNIRPEFFCRHRERLALQSWLLQRSTASSKHASGGINHNLQMETNYVSCETGVDRYSIKRLIYEHTKN
ncbi:uncharacterized protein LOC124409043 [Diprion similis]|uniref:uncharacterized protein LOC124409043 n=1 Tax=Diprion similis TaxID=362088 RepID=UPI001EF83A60|nr:uncharacterized protein LOC124409043 [Diprion similis]